jgi:predicted nucleic acid-binding Zn ribbon protein
MLRMKLVMMTFLGESVTDRPQALYGCQRFCVLCGSVFAAYAEQKYCSKACKQKAYRQRKRQTTESTALGQSLILPCPTVEDDHGL